MSRIVFFFCLLLFSGITALAQSKAEFVNYEQYPERIMESLKTEQTKSPFDALPVLKERCGKAMESLCLELEKFQKISVKELPVRDLVKKVKPSSLIICKYKRGFGAYPDFILIGATAIALSRDGLCVSNYHVFEGLINQGQSLMPQDSLIFLADVDGNAFSIDRVLTYNKSADLAVFKVNTRGRELIPVTMGNDACVGDRVHTLTHPDQFLFYYTEGVVARNSAFSDSSWDNRTEITADYGIGSSGGPIFDDCGNLVAVASSTTSVYAQRGQSRDCQMVVKLGIPVSSLKMLLLK